jgi:Sulfotransferase family
VERNTHLLPTFFLVGAAKTGTTSLYHYLNQHPDIYMSPVKEPCYFASEVRLKVFGPEYQAEARRYTHELTAFLDGPMSTPDPGGIVEKWEDYIRLFRNVKNEKAIGEASVCYLWSPTAPARIHSTIPGAKILMILRDPAERAFSQYMQYAANGLVTCPFREHIASCANHTGREFDIHYPFLEYGLYFNQVKAYLDLFPRTNIQIYIYEEVWKDPSRFLRSIFGHLEVDVQFRPDVSQRSLQRRAPKSPLFNYVLRRSGFAPRLKHVIPGALWNGIRSAFFRAPEQLRMDESDREFLKDYYHDDVTKLASLLNRDLGVWMK